MICGFAALRLRDFALYLNLKTVTPSQSYQPVASGTRSPWPKARFASRMPLTKSQTMRRVVSVFMVLVTRYGVGDGIREEGHDDPGQACDTVVRVASASSSAPTHFEILDGKPQRSEGHLSVRADTGEDRWAGTMIGELA